MVRLFDIALRSRIRALAAVLLVALIVAGCGGGDGDATPTVVPDAGGPNGVPASPVAIASPVRDFAPLPPAQLTKYQPNELGSIPILEYHDLVESKKEEGQFARTRQDFRADLTWLYEHDFSIVPLEDVIRNRIKAPAGKHPVVLTFDDSYASQFRFLVQDDGSLKIDPTSAVGIIEKFSSEHTGFGKGAFFAVIANFCFNWTATTAEADQTPYCGQKISWLLDNGYEVGNHSVSHPSLADVDDDTFREEIGGAVLALQKYDKRVDADIIAMPFGIYPDPDTRDQQRQWLRDGFTYKGRSFNVIGCLMVGSGPTVSPVSTDWDPVYIQRIQAFDADAQVPNAKTLTQWFADFEQNPGQLYTSDGNSNTITIPKKLARNLVGTIDARRILDDGRTLIRY